MRFWDASAIVPLLLRESHTGEAIRFHRTDPGIVVWWGTRVECRSAIERRVREGSLALPQATRARMRFVRLFEDVDEIAPSTVDRNDAERLLARYALRAADALQLAAAFAWAGNTPAGRQLVCFDARLRAAAHAEGFSLLPTGL
ncbi:MAG TPA: type II toxin-antitoxin system VapC family toxin [Chloroflexota bacterium]|nr:type II toxin-antitoxin system VapC family toxin [Chloroflexota bacterium]